MPWKYNPFTDSLDQTGSGGGSYIDGEVEYHSNLPVTAGTPAVNSAFLVRKGEGLYFISRKPAGIWVRELNNGNLDDWKYAGTFSDLYRDANFRILNNTDVTKELAFDVSGVATGTTRTITMPNVNVTLPNQGTSTTDGVSFYSVETETDLIVGGDLNITNSLTVGANGIYFGSGGDAATRTNLGLGSSQNVTFGSIQNTPIGSTTRNSGAFTTLNANNGTLTASAPVLDLAQTWNNAAVAFTGINLDITNTASNLAGSKMLSLGVGGSSIFSIYRSTNASFSGATMVELGSSGLTTRIRTRTGAGVGLNFEHTVGIGSNLQFGVGSGTTGGDVVLQRDDAANILALRNGTSAQTFRLYNTYTDASNYERGFMRWSSNVLQIGTEALGTGSARALELQTGGTTRFTIATNGAITCSRSLSVVSNLDFQGNAAIVGNIASGVLRLVNSGATDFNRLQFGGGTSSFPALKRSSTVLQSRLADDSDFCPLQGQLRIHQNAASETITATHTLTLFDAAGTAYKVPCVAA